MMTRRDLAFPFRIAPASSRGAEATYADHVDQMLRQLLLTSPGERVCLPEFGCGLRRLVFAPISDALEATVKIQVRDAIERWLAPHVRLVNLEVQSGAIDSSAGLDVGEFLVSVTYVLVETQTTQQLDVKVS